MDNGDRALFIAGQWYDMNPVRDVLGSNAVVSDSCKHLLVKEIPTENAMETEVTGISLRSEFVARTATEAVGMATNKQILTQQKAGKLKSTMMTGLGKTGSSSPNLSAIKKPKTKIVDILVDPEKEKLELERAHAELEKMERRKQQKARRHEEKLAGLGSRDTVRSRRFRSHITEEALEAESSDEDMQKESRGIQRKRRRTTDGYELEDDFVVDDDEEEEEKDADNMDEDQSEEEEEESSEEEEVPKMLAGKSVREQKQQKARLKEKLERKARKAAHQKEKESSEEEEEGEEVDSVAEDDRDITEDKNAVHPKLASLQDDQVRELTPSSVPSSGRRRRNILADSDEGSD